MKNQNPTPYNTDMSKAEFIELWKAAHSMVIYLNNGSPAAPVQNFKAAFAKKNDCANDTFIKKFLEACNKDGSTIAHYINMHYTTLVG